MTINKARRLSPGEIAEAVKVVIALQGRPDYTPLNPQCSVENLTALYDTAEEQKEQELRAQDAAKAARDASVAAEWQLYETAQAAKLQARAQFGKDSDFLRRIGLKPTSDYKRPLRKTKEQREAEKKTKAAAAEAAKKAPDA